MKNLYLKEISLIVFLVIGFAQFGHTQEQTQYDLIMDRLDAAQPLDPDTLPKELENALKCAVYDPDVETPASDKLYAVVFKKPGDRGPLDPNKTFVFPVHTRNGYEAKPNNTCKTFYKDNYFVTFCHGYATYYTTDGQYVYFYQNIQCNSGEEKERVGYCWKVK